MSEVPTQPASAVDDIIAACHAHQPNSTPTWPADLISALDLARVKRRVIRSRDPDRLAEPLDREIRHVASPLLNSPEGAAIWAGLLTRLEDPNDFLAPWIGRRYTQRLALATLATGALFVVPLIGVIWAHTAEVTAALAISLAILGAAALCTSVLAGWRAAGLTISSFSRATTIFWLAPLLIAFVTATIGVELGLHKTSGLYPAIAAAAIMAAIITGGLLVWRARMTNEPTSGPDYQGWAKAAATDIDIRRTLSVLRDYARCCGLRDRRSSRLWLWAYILVAALGAAGAAVAGVAAAHTALGPTWLIVTLALVGAAATAISTGINPGHEWKAADQRASAFERLTREVDAMCQLDLVGYEQKKLSRSAVQYVLDKVDHIRQTPDSTRSFWRDNASEVEPRGGEAGKGFIGSKRSRASSRPRP